VLSFVISVFLFVVSTLVTDGTFYTSPSQMIKFTLTGFSTQSLYYAQIIHTTTVKITATIICRAVSFYFFLDWVCHHGVCL
jgi:hypothetical protein